MQRVSRLDVRDASRSCSEPWSPICTTRPASLSRRNFKGTCSSVEMLKGTWPVKRKFGTTYSNIPIVGEPQKLQIN